VSSAPTSSANALGQPAVVRQSSTTASAPQAPSSIGGEAAFATATGAAAGAASAQATARARLQRLVDSVARQELHLTWALADRPDGTTVLATDIASGWIPPWVQIPVGVQLLEPARRRGDIAAMLGEVTDIAAYSPGQYLPEPDEQDPVTMSNRARQAATVDELNWELSQATKWRDGLPRLAHTLAKAAAAGTGVLDSEVELLHESLTTVRAHLVDKYPAPDPVAVANCALLAAIDTLVGGDRTGANYHFAWFRALDRSTIAA
jgi:hypothetical protein